MKQNLKRLFTAAAFPLAALAAETPQASAAVGATMGKAKLLGLDKQIIDHRSADGSMSPVAPVYNIVKSENK